MRLHTHHLKGKYLLGYPMAMFSILFILLCATHTTEIFTLLSNSFANAKVATLQYFAETSSLHLILTLIATILFVVTALVIFGFSHIIKNKKTVKRRANNKEKYQNFLAGVVSQEVILENGHFLDAADYTYLSFKDLTDPESRQDLLVEIKALHDVIVGKEQERVSQLYKALGYIDDLKDRMQSDKWIDKVEVINEINQFKLFKYTDFIQQCVDDKNKNVANVAFSAMIERLDNPFEILTFMDGPLNRWEKHVIFQKVKKMDNLQDLEFLSLLRTHPKHVSYIIDVYEKLSIDFSSMSDEKSKYAVSEKGAKPKDPLNIYSSNKEKLSKDLKSVLEDYKNQIEKESLRESNRIVTLKIAGK